jgi:hypothetical protein
MERAERRMQQAENAMSLPFLDSHIKVQNLLPLEDYISRVQRSAGEIHVVEAEEYAEVLKEEEKEIVAVFTDGNIIGFEKDSFIVGRNGEKHEPSYVAWVTTSFNRAKNVFEDKPFTYHLVTRDHTREDVMGFVEKTGKRLTII